jgi:hypothetical protein
MKNIPRSPVARRLPEFMGQKSLHLSWFKNLISIILTLAKKDSGHRVHQ